MGQAESHQSGSKNAGARNSQEYIPGKLISSQKDYSAKHLYDAQVKTYSFTTKDDGRSAAFSKKMN